MRTINNIYRKQNDFPAPLTKSSLVSTCAGTCDGDAGEGAAVSSECVQPPTKSGRFQAPAISAPKSVPWIISALSMTSWLVIVFHSL